MTERLDRIVIVAADPLRGRAAGMSVQHLLEVSPGRDVEIGPVPLSEAELGAYAAQWNASLVLERDALATQVEQLTAERATIQAQCDAHSQRIADLLDGRETLLEQVATLTTERDEALAEVRPAEAARDKALADLESGIAAKEAAIAATLAAKDARIAQLESELDALLNPPVNPRHFAPFDFLKLFRPEEVIAVQTTTDGPAVIARAKLQTIITYVDLDDPDTIQAVNYFETAGIIAEGRAATILAGEPWE